jgi:Ser/Thr protein kinase RdoA (MazF antagonist)
VDDAQGQPGARAVVSADLEEFLRANWGVRLAGATPDLGGSSNLNLLVTDGRPLKLARVYRPFVTGQRIAALQAVRRYLASHGILCAAPSRPSAARESSCSPSCRRRWPTGD